MGGMQIPRTPAEWQRMVDTDRRVGELLAAAQERWMAEHGEKRRKACEAFGLEPERWLFG